MGLDMVPLNSKPQPEPIKMIVEPPFLPRLTPHEAAIAGAETVQRAYERLSERMAEIISDYYKED